MVASHIREPGFEVWLHSWLQLSYTMEAVSNDSDDCLPCRRPRISSLRLALLCPTQTVGCIYEVNQETGDSLLFVFLCLSGLLNKINMYNF